jgi:hypothetical protein
LLRERDQERLLTSIADTNCILSKQQEEYVELRSELGVAENRNYVERREIERLELDLREASSLSDKYHNDIARTTEQINSRDMDIRGYKVRAEQLEGELE